MQKFLFHNLHNKVFVSDPVPGFKGIFLIWIFAASFWISLYLWLIWFSFKPCYENISCNQWVSIRCHYVISQPYDKWSMNYNWSRFSPSHITPSSFFVLTFGCYCITYCIGVKAITTCFLLFDFFQFHLGTNNAIKTNIPTR